jgi:hypothetical protein
MGITSTNKMLFPKSEGKRPPQKLICRREGNIGTDVKDRGCQDVDWIQLTQD